jgi:Na+/H+ antiporter NhaD/arsenite permease-like protein
MVVVFVLGYAAIAFEHTIHVDKAASALITGVVCWAIYALSAGSLVNPDDIPAHITVPSISGDEPSKWDLIMHYVAEHQLFHHLAEIAGILFFLLGAMTIVETIDIHGGFSVITDKIKTTERSKLMWIITFTTFFLSAALDNLTTTIVMASLLKKLIQNYKDRWLFAGMVVVAANAGGAFSPIGDITTTMLWIGKQITTVKVITMVFLPSVVALLVPVLILSSQMKGNISTPIKTSAFGGHGSDVDNRTKKIVFIVGLLGLVFVPIFKTVTHLPPFMGMMLSLGVMWVVTELLHSKKPYAIKKSLNMIASLKKVDIASMLFFLGILLAVGSLQSAGQLGHLAEALDNSLDTENKTGVFSVGILIGLLSAVVDNVPLVAAAMGMYDIVPGTFFAQDGLFWEFLAFTAGTGGSALIIGSAAGVAVMGIERITFGWYLRKIAPLALIGYFAGALVYIVQSSLFH